jgi:hypothetical protein
MYNDGLIATQLANLTARAKKSAALIGMAATSDIFKKW